MQLQNQEATIRPAYRHANSRHQYDTFQQTVSSQQPAEQQSLQTDTKHFRFRIVSDVNTKQVF